MITRFPPSPTGYLHIGGARTALFNWLLARANNGKFVLRIEDTDRARSTDEMTRAIVDAMHWLGLDWDQGPYHQSERQDLYNQAVDRLLDEGKAYWCECTPEEVEAMREEARAKGEKPKYAGRCRERAIGPGENRVVRFKAPQDGNTVFEDVVKGPQSWNNKELDDFVIRRADGWVTYNMAVVVDDADMGVTDILRGDDHLSNTPKQVLLYRALGLDEPRFGHVPMILGPDGKKLSKRHGAVSVMEYEKQGFLPEAMVNYLVRLGWSKGDEEIFSRDELIEKFGVKGLSSSAARIDLEKLKWLNAHYIKEKDPAELAPLLARHLTDLGRENVDGKLLEQIVPLYQPRAQTMVEMAEQAEFFVIPDQELPYDEKSVNKFLTPEAKEHLAEIRGRLAALGEFGHDELDAAIRGYVEEKEIKFKAVAQPIRVAITGKTQSPGLFETMEVLGKDSTLARMDRALAL